MKVLTSLAGSATFIAFFLAFLALTIALYIPLFVAALFLGAYWLFNKKSWDGRLKNLFEENPYSSKLRRPPGRVLLKWIGYTVTTPFCLGFAGFYTVIEKLRLV